MPVIITDPTDPVGQTREPVYVWQSLGEPGEYALCTNSRYVDFQNGNWKALGELPGVPVLATFPRLTVDNGTVGGWPFIVRVVGNGKFMF